MQQQQLQKYDIDEDGIPRNNKVYKEKEYWDFRFQTETEYDWIANFKDMAESSQGFLTEFQEKLVPNKKILNIGNGTSKLPEQLCEMGVLSENLISCDYIENVIQKMQQKYQDKFGSWEVADITKLEDSFQQMQFDVVIEKCTIDALTVAPKDPWNPDQETKDKIKSVFKGVHKILKNPGDIFVSLSFEQPHFRKKYFDEEIEQLFTNLQYQRKIEVGFNECYVYYFQKK